MDSLTRCLVAAAGAVLLVLGILIVVDVADDFLFGSVYAGPPKELYGLAGAIIGGLVTIAVARVTRGKK